MSQHRILPMIVLHASYDGMVIEVKCLIIDTQVWAPKTMAFLERDTILHPVSDDGDCHMDGLWDIRLFLLY